MKSKLLISLSISLVLLIGLAVQTNAGSSYTASLSFFQGFDLEEGTVNEGIREILEKGTESPDVIRLVFVMEDIEPEKVTYNFDPSTDFQIGYSAESDFYGVVPTDFTAFAVIENQAFESVQNPNINTLQLRYDPLEIRFEDPNYTIVVLTRDDNFFKIGNFSSDGSMLSFDYEKLQPETTPIPEPAMFILIVVGLLGMVGLRMRTNRNKR